jgi:hypothetical protein
MVHENLSKAVLKALRKEQKTAPRRRLANLAGKP